MNHTQYLVQNRSTLLIFRDCLKLSNRMARRSTQAPSIRALVRREFQRHREVFDQDQIKLLKMNAVKGISNYIIYTVQEQYNLKPKKQINIMDEKENTLEQEENFEKEHFKHNDKVI